MTHLCPVGSRSSGGSPRTTWTLWTRKQSELQQLKSWGLSATIYEFIYHSQYLCLWHRGCKFPIIQQKKRDRKCSKLKSMRVCGVKRGAQRERGCGTIMTLYIASFNSLLFYRHRLLVLFQIIFSLCSTLPLKHGRL